MGAEGKRQRNFKFGQRRGNGVNALAGGLEPAGNLGEFEGLELVWIKASKTNAAALRTPYSEIRWWHQERTAVGVERQARVVGFRLEAERDQITQRALIAVVSPSEASGGRIERWESFPVPGSGTRWFEREFRAEREAVISVMNRPDAARLHIGANELTISSMAVPG